MGGVVKAVTSVVSGVAKAVSGAVGGTASGVGSCAQKTVKGVSTGIGSIIKNPLPVIETVAVAYVAGPAVASALGPTAAPATVAATTSAVSSAAVKAANGGNVGDIATAAITSGAGAVVGQAAGATVGADTTLGKVAASAAGASTSTTLSALASGKSLSDAVQAGTTAALVAGATTGTIEAAKAAVEQPIPGTGLKVPTAAPDSTALTGDIQSTGLKPEVAGTAPEIGAGTGLKASPTDLLTPALASYTTQTGDVISGGGGTLQPAKTAAADVITPPQYLQYLDPTQQEYRTQQMTEQPIGKVGEKALSTILSPFYSSLFGSSANYPSGGTSPAATYDVGTAPVSGMPGTQALAQALRIGDPGESLFASGKEGKQRDVWNLASLKVKDETGA